MPLTIGRRPRALRGIYIDEPVDAPTLRTKRLVLRPHRLDDAEQWYRLQSDPQVIRYLRWPERDRRASRRHLRDRTRHTRLWQENDFLALAIELDGTLIGDVSLHLRTAYPDSRTAEIGWVVDPAYGHNGYTSEAANAMLDLAFGALRAKLVMAVANNRNTPSIALAERLSFVPASRGEESTVLVLTAQAHADMRSSQYRRRQSA
ncbi:GNAT family N-acetyltransferase [Microbacterium sp. No. 7]|uniref:GNAT family N-acetyltransferase n=1 Tax=Microbacterium sp. No. 7 TaxID=1714373 RepID=UPI0006ED12B3|nr:GNAT family N-acetyltransferase [Microbacterium sp. No. 7]ALJ22174.1 hypothetical protein AOA12_20725 [Microbacterium sp. No. 7]